MTSMAPGTRAGPWREDDVRCFRLGHGPAWPFNIPARAICEVYPLPGGGAQARVFNERGEVIASLVARDEADGRRFCDEELEGLVAWDSGAEPLRATEESIAELLRLAEQLP